MSRFFLTHCVGLYIKIWTELKTLSHPVRCWLGYSFDWTPNEKKLESINSLAAAAASTCLLQMTSFTRSRLRDVTSWHIIFLFPFFFPSPSLLSVEISRVFCVSNSNLIRNFCRFFSLLCPPPRVIIACSMLPDNVVMLHGVSKSLFLAVYQRLETYQTNFLYNS